MKKYILLIGIITFIFGSCGKKEEKNIPEKQEKVIVEIVKFKTKIQGKEIKNKTGDNFKIIVTDYEKLDSVSFSVNGKTTVIINEPYEYQFDTDTFRTGKTEIQTICYSGENSTRKTDYIELYSDIKPRKYGYKIQRFYPHDREAYTQGLFYDEGLLYEATGLNGKSSLRKVKLETGEVLQSYILSSEYFGEGITLIDDKIIQVTWQDHQGFVYDKNNFSILDRFNYSTEGWGLCNDGTKIYMSDGTNIIHILDKVGFSQITELQVYTNEHPLYYINEMEFIKGKIYANIYRDDRIAIIDPKTGKVEAFIDLTGILPKIEKDQTTDVLNGIAYDKKNDRIFVTGKNWPKLYHIKITK